LTDEYVRHSNNNEVTRSWQSGAHEFHNVARKEEKDWKMVYLARKGFDFKQIITIIISFQLELEPCFSYRKFKFNFVIFKKYSNKFLKLPMAFL
jgi:hypothetical protein